MSLLTWLFGTPKKDECSSVKAQDNNKRLTQKKEIDWRNSTAHLLLLSKFFHGSSVEYYVHTDYWEPALNEPPAIAIKRFIDDRMLEVLDVSSRIHLKFNVSDLKGMLKERGLKVSGNKTILVDRLLENDRHGMEKVVAESEMYKCSPAGVSVAQAYLTSQNEKRARLEDEVLNLLKERQFKKAMRAIATHELSQVFSRGLGMNWDYYGSETDVLELAAIFEKTPGILDGITEDRLSPLRLAAGMVHLLGTNKISPWLPPDYETGIRFDAETAVAMLLSHARYYRRMFELNDKDITAFIKEVEFSCIDNNDTCAVCRKMNGRKYKINKFPELPYPKCTSPSGCRCSVFAVFDHK